MTDWPDDWFRDGRQQAGNDLAANVSAVPAGSGGAGPAGAANADPTVRLSSRSPGGQPGPSGRTARAGGWPEQPAIRTGTRTARPANG
ncbi:MAG: hypothetical protein ACYCU3_20225, partial [Streptosporangiaceae bacterium]